MAKKITLTWLNPNKEIVIENCELLEEDDALFSKSGELVFGCASPLMASNMVLFEDSDGIFGLPPNQILNIEIAD